MTQSLLWQTYIQVGGVVADGTGEVVGTHVIKVMHVQSQNGGIHVVFLAFAES